MRKKTDGTVFERCDRGVEGQEDRAVSCRIVASRRQQGKTGPARLVAFPLEPGRHRIAGGADLGQPLPGRVARKQRGRRLPESARLDMQADAGNPPWTICAADNQPYWATSRMCAQPALIRSRTATARALLGSTMFTRGESAARPT